MLKIATTAPAPIRKRRKRIDDAPFIAALDFDFRNATTIARHMLAAGTPASLPTIRQRMTEYVSETALVEAQGASWRIAPTSPTTSPQPSNDNAPTMLPIGLHHGCGLELMRSLPDASVDLVLCDLPYGATGLAIDPKIDVAEWMAEMRRVVTEKGAIVAFAAQPFTTDLVNAGRKLLKTEIIWAKTKPTGFQLSHGQMMRGHESILVFSKGAAGAKKSKRQMTYNPQGARMVVKANRKKNRTVGYLSKPVITQGQEGQDYVAMEGCPIDVICFAKDETQLHSFAKPIGLLDYLIRTYSNEGSVILDPTMGSGSTGVACAGAGRHFIGAENGVDRKGRCIFTIAKDRIASHAVANENVKPSKPRRKPPVVKPTRPRPPVVRPDDLPPPMIIPPF